MSFNPNSTGTVGLEWRAYKKGSATVNSNAVAVAAYLNSSVTETIDSLIVPFTPAGAGSSYGKLWAEIYNAADLGLNETVVETTYVPNEDESIVNMFDAPTAWAAGPYNDLSQALYDNINDTSDESTDYIMGGNTSKARFDFNTAGLGAGRVLYIKVEVRAFSYSGFPGQGLYVDLYNNTTFVARLGTVQPPVNGDDIARPFTNYTLGPFYVNPLTEEPWTRADIITFDSGTGLMIQLTWRSNTTAVAALRVKVGMIAEKRIAVGANTKTTSPVSGLQTANVHSLKTPAAVDNWAKSNALDYVVVVRRLDDPSGSLAAQSATVGWIDSDAANPHNQGHGYPVTIDAGGRLLTAPGIETKAYPILMVVNSTNVLSADSQVYHSLLNARAYTGITSTQRISNHASTTYGTIRAIVGVLGEPTAQLTAKIKRVSDNVQMGGDAPKTVASLSTSILLGVADGITWYDATFTLASNATLVSGTQYYIEFSSTTTAAKPWYLRALDYTETHAFGTDQSYGGSADYVIIEGVTYAQADLATTTSTAASIPDPPPPPGLPPGTPGSLTVAVVNYALPDAGDPLCDPGLHQVARLTWGTTAEGVLFDYYGIERSEDGGSTWTLIKRVQAEATLTFDDVEAARGAAVKYRIRVVRTTGQVGSYLTQTGTTVLAANTASAIFCTNQYPSLTCGYLRLGADHEYTFLSDNEVSVVQMHGRDFQVVFRPLEDRGVMTQIPVLIFTKGNDSRGDEVPPEGKGMQAFDAVRAIVETDAPYVCVHTPDGERLFAGLRLPSGRRSEPASYYVATITAIQVASEPTVVD